MLAVKIRVRQPRECKTSTAADKFLVFAPQSQKHNVNRKKQRDMFDGITARCGGKPCGARGVQTVYPIHTLETIGKNSNNLDMPPAYRGYTILVTRLPTYGFEAVGGNPNGMCHVLNCKTTQIATTYAPIIFCLATTLDSNYMPPCGSNCLLNN